MKLLSKSNTVNTLGFNQQNVAEQMQKNSTVSTYSLTRDGIGCRKPYKSKDKKPIERWLLT